MVFSRIILPIQTVIALLKDHQFCLVSLCLCGHFSGLSGLGILKREIGVEISEQVEKALTPDLQKGWQSVEAIGSKDLRDSIK